MDNRSSIRTVGMVAGTVILLIVLFLVAGISTGFLPWRDSYAQQPWPTKNVDAIAPTPTATAKPTPTPTPVQNVQTTSEPDPTPTPTPEATPTPTPVPTPGVTLDEELPTYTITVTFSRGGSAIPYGINSVVENGSMTVVAVPDEGYVVDEMIIDGEAYKGITSYVFEDVICNHTVYISFSRSLFAPTPTPAITPTPVPEITE